MLISGLYIVATKKLFNLLGLSVRKPFITYEDHSEQEKYQQIIDLINDGNSVALVSDAGSPLISDPGYKLVKECRRQNIKVTTIPGASAVISALQLSGLPTNRFMFSGFIPNKDKARIDLFTELKSINTTLVLYETAIRLEKSLSVLEKIMPEREIAVVREITKMYEECLNGSVSEVLHRIRENPVKGEIVLVIAPPSDLTKQEIDVEALLKKELKHLSLKEAVKKVTETYKLKRNDVYEAALKIKNQSV